MSIIGNGSDIIIFNATTGDPIACQRGVNVSFNMDLIDVTCKQDSGNATYLGGLRSFTIDTENLVDWTPAINTEGISELLAAYDARTPLEINISDPTNVNIYFNGVVYIESIEVNAGTETEVSYTATLTGTGDFASLVS